MEEMSPVCSKQISRVLRRLPLFSVDVVPPVEPGSLVFHHSPWMEELSSGAVVALPVHWNLAPQ
tara:strand:- start:1239 stop:1430 length:192 start_codon:yes stop_codon:yes gene_type:complete